MGDAGRRPTTKRVRGSLRPRCIATSSDPATMQEGADRFRSQFRPAAAVTLAFLLVCGLVAVAFVVEVDLDEETSQPVVLSEAMVQKSAAFHAGKARAHARFAKMYKGHGLHEDAAKHAALARKHLHLSRSKSTATDAGAWLARVKKSRKHLKIVDVVNKKKEKTSQERRLDAIAAKKDAIRKQHQNNKLVRKTMRDEGRRAAKKLVSKALDAMTDNVRNMAASAAKNAANGVVSKTASARAKLAKKRSMSAKAKLKMLEKDVALLEAAEKKALGEARAAKARFQAKDAKYKAIVNAKVLRAQKDFEIMKKKLAAYKGAKRTERLTAERLRRLAQEVVRLSARLKRERAHVARLQAKLKKKLAKDKLFMKAKRKQLKAMVKRFKAILKALRAKLNKLRNKPAVSVVMASRIKAEEGVVAQQEAKLAQENAYIKRLKAMLRRAEHTHVVLTTKAKKRKQVLRIAHVAYSNLERAVAHLKAMAAQHAKTVNIKGPHANAAKDTRVFVRNMVRTVRQLQRKSKRMIARAVARKAAAAAAAEARANDKMGLADTIPGLNRALAKAKGSLKNLGKPPRGYGKKKKKNMRAPHALAAASRLLRRTRKAATDAKIKVTAIKRVHGARHKAVLLQEDEESDEGAHARANVLARVAHRLFRKAQKTKTRSDRAAAKLAMKRALAARQSLD